MPEIEGEKQSKKKFKTLINIPSPGAPSHSCRCRRAPPNSTRKKNVWQFVRALGERGTARLNEAVAAYREALKERTRAGKSGPDQGDEDGVSEQRPAEYRSCRPECRQAIR